MRSALILLAGLFFFSTTSVRADNQESLHDKVIRVGELRCGYALWPGLLEKDPNTGAMSGLFYDYMEQLGSSMQIKIVWAEEVPWGDIVEALQARRIDAHCAGAWTNAIRGKFVDFTTPIIFHPINAYVREGDTRFDNNLSAINSPDVTISIVDSESAATVAKTDFPKAKTISMPKGTEGAQMILNVLHKKADITFTDPSMAQEIMKNNPGKLRQVQAQFPLRVFGVGLAIRKGETTLKDSLNVATNQLLWAGGLEKILNKYEKFPGQFLRVAQPYISIAPKN